MRFATIISGLITIWPHFAFSQSPGDIYFTTTSLILRSEPSRSGQNLKLIPKYDPVVLLASTDHEETIEGKKGAWVNVKTFFDSKEGFVFNGFITKANVVARPREMKMPESLIHCSGEGYIECIHQAHVKIGKEYPGLLSVSPEQLTVHLKNGGIKTFPIESKVVDSLKYPAIQHVYDNVGYVFIEERHYEGVGFFLVNLRDGTTINLIDVPVLSPDKQRFMAVCSAANVAYTNPGIQIINIQTDKPVIEYDDSNQDRNLGTPFDWQHLAQWKDSKTIRVYRYVQIAHGFAEQELQLRLINGKWVVE